MLLYGYKYLVGVHRLDEVVGNLAAYSLVHYIFFFALGNHYHGRLRLPLLYQSESLKPGKSRHILVEYYQVERLGHGHVERVAPVVRSHDVVAAVAQKEQVGLEKVYLIVGPKYALLCCHNTKLRKSRYDALPDAFFFRNCANIAIFATWKLFRMSCRCAASQ